MTAQGLLAALAGALVVAGAVCGAAAFVTVPARTDAAARPPSRLAGLVRAALEPRSRRRIAVAVVLGLLVLLFTGWPVAALGALAGAVAAPRLLSKRPAEQRIEKLEALESWTRQVAVVLKASRGLEDALTQSVRKVRPPIQAEVRTLARRLASRMPSEQALRLFAEDLADPVGDRIAAALILAASRRGTGVGDVLSALARMVAEDVRARRDIEASRAQHRTTLRWVLVFLAGYTVVVSMRQSYSAPFGTFAGQVAMSVVVVLYAAGLWWIHRLASPEKQPRLLSQEADAQGGTAVTDGAA
ncbi:type II secretion system F family protein [Actinomadura chibensis]|uniref:Type II secretion system F family protein n=1 Tax=Actinomadura chibensis TaxID=392828 RepID=A0A5D0NX25_9ACTN|nr:type II secretion system F family protein [Actinomadura chibensis]TYB48551.1 type II secretion system F family protein [Actinomadura chibensis]